jgi:hypothetical protein
VAPSSGLTTDLRRSACHSGDINRGSSVLGASATLGTTPSPVKHQTDETGAELAGVLARVPRYLRQARVCPADEVCFRRSTHAIGRDRRSALGFQLLSRRSRPSAGQFASQSEPGSSPPLRCGQATAMTQIARPTTIIAQRPLRVLSRHLLLLAFEHSAHIETAATGGTRDSWRANWRAGPAKRLNQPNPSALENRWACKRLVGSNPTPAVPGAR